MTSDSDRRRFLACLSDPSRFSLVTALADGPRCVTELATLVGLSQSCTTRHLQALHREAIVSVRREGKRVVYSLRHEGHEAHPVLLWACDRIQPAGGAPVPKPGRTRHRTRLKAGWPDAIAGGHGENPLDAAMAHESGWTAADSPAPTGVDPLPPSEAAATQEEHPGIRRADMDDFLL